MHILSDPAQTRTTTTPLEAAASLLGWGLASTVAGWGYLAVVDATVLAGVSPALLRYHLVGLMVLLTMFAATAIAAGVGVALTWLVDR